VAVYAFQDRRTDRQGRQTICTIQGARPSFYGTAAPSVCQVLELERDLQQAQSRSLASERDLDALKAKFDAQMRLKLKKEGILMCVANCLSVCPSVRASAARQRHLPACVCVAAIRGLSLSAHLSVRLVRGTY
jgi:hypothetical protein